MKISEITTDIICSQLRVDKSYLTEEDTALFPILQSAAVDYVKSYTGLDDDGIEEHEDLTIAVLVLITDMYDNRQMTVDSGNVNRVVDTILGMHSINLL